MIKMQMSQSLVLLRHDKGQSFMGREAERHHGLYFIAVFWSPCLSSPFTDHDCHSELCSTGIGKRKQWGICILTFFLQFFHKQMINCFGEFCHFNIAPNKIGWKLAMRMLSNECIGEGFSFQRTAPEVQNMNSPMATPWGKGVQYPCKLHKERLWGT
jgi:hypothetical protein